MSTTADLGAAARALDAMYRGLNDLGDLVTEVERNRLVAILGKADRRWRDRAGLDR